MPIFNLTIDDRSPIIKYKGNWQDTNPNINNASLFTDGTFHSSQGKNAEASFAFNGTGVWLYGVKRGDQLNYSVTVDGQTVGTQGGTSKFLQVLYSNPDLPYGEHQVTLKNSGAQSFVDFDSVVITTGDGNPNTASEDTMLEDDAFTFDANWDNGPQEFSSSLSNNSAYRTSTPNASATLSFQGNAFSLFGSTGNLHGQFSVAMDGANPVVLNGHTPEDHFKAGVLLYHWDGLDDGQHLLTVTNGNLSSVVDIDRVAINRYTVPDRSNTTSADMTHSASSRPAPGALAGIIVGIIALLVVVSLGLWWLARRNLRDARRRHGPVKEIVIDDGHDRDYERGVEDMSSAPGQPLFINPFEDKANVISRSHSSLLADPEAPPAYNGPTHPVPGANTASRTIPLAAYHPDSKASVTQSTSVFPPEKFSRFQEERKTSAANLATISGNLTSASALAVVNH